MTRLAHIRRLNSRKQITMLTAADKVTRFLDKFVAEWYELGNLRDRHDIGTGDNSSQLFISIFSLPFNCLKEIYWTFCLFCENSLIGFFYI